MGLCAILSKCEVRTIYKALRELGAERMSRDNHVRKTSHELILDDVGGYICFNILAASG